MVKSRESEMINVTALARMFHQTTSDTVKNLSKAGIEPLQAITMPSGRRFMTFDKVAAVKALQKRRDMLHPPVRKSGTISVQQQGNLESEVKELRAIVAQLLEAVTKPSQH